MKTSCLVSLLAAGCGALPALAEVALTFDTDTQGFTKGDHATSLAWSNYNGGSLEVVIPAGWKTQSAFLNISDNATLFAELKKAMANGGTLSYTIFVEPAGVIGTPGWFEGAQIGNSAGGWDQSYGPSKGLIGLYGGSFPLTQTYRFDVSYPIEDGPATDDARAQFQGADWAQLNIGLNSGGGDFTQATLYIDNLKIVANEAPGPPIIPKLTVRKAARGLNMLASGSGQYERRMIRTTGPEPACSWVGAATPANPVTYSFTVREFPQQTGFNAFLYFLPGTDLAQLTDPDYSEPTVFRFTMGRSAANQPTSFAEVAYKVNQPASNGPAGHEYWTDDTVPSSGLGGRLLYHGAGAPEGQWKLTFTGDTEFTVTAPDGTTKSGSMLQETANLFAGNLYVYLAIMPGSAANIGLDASFSNFSISGVTGAFSENFEVPLADGAKHVTATPTTRTGVNVVTEFDPYWVRWTLPATGFKLMHGPDLGAVEPWVALDMTKAITVSDKEVLYLFNLGDAYDFDIGFFRMEKPATTP